MCSLTRLLASSLLVILTVRVATCCNAATVDHLGPNERLDKNDSLVSNNGRFALRMQSDGNLVLYRLSDNRALWDSKTYKAPAGDFAIMQLDGNLVVYSGNKAVFNTGTWKMENSKLQMQDDGNLVIYNPSNKAVWNTGTWERPPKKKFRIIILSMSGNEMFREIIEADSATAAQAKGLMRFHEIYPDGPMGQAALNVDEEPN